MILLGFCIGRIKRVGAREGMLRCMPTTMRAALTHYGKQKCMMVIDGVAAPGVRSGNVVGPAFIHSGTQSHSDQPVRSFSGNLRCFYQKKMALYIGKIHPNEFISLSLYNNDERSQFLNAENDGNLTVPSDGTYARRRGL